MSTPSPPPATPNDTQSNHTQSNDTPSDQTTTQSDGTQSNGTQSNGMQSVDMSLLVHDPESDRVRAETHTNTTIKSAIWFLEDEDRYESWEGPRPWWEGARKILEGAHQKANVLACLEPSEQTSFSGSSFGCAD
jgi:hypothetical protein